MKYGHASPMKAGTAFVRLASGRELNSVATDMRRVSTAIEAWRSERMLDFALDRKGCLKAKHAVPTSHFA